MLTGSTGVGVSSAAMIAARSRAKIDVARWYDAEWQLLFLLMVVCEDDYSFLLHRIRSTIVEWRRLSKVVLGECDYSGSVASW